MDQIDPKLAQIIEEKRKKAIELYNKRKLLKQNNQPNVSNQNRNNVNQSKYFRLDQSNSNKPNPQPKSNDNAKNIAEYTQINDRKKVEANNSETSASTQLKKVIKISIKLIDHQRFLLQFPYDEQIIKKIKIYESRQYDPVKKHWTLALNEYGRLMNDLKELNLKNSDLRIDLEKNLTEKLITLLLEYSQKHRLSIDLLEKLDQDFHDKLYKYQRDGIVFGIQNDGRCLIADDMGLGKTIQAIGLAKWYRQDWPLIITCPSSLRFQWKEKCLEYFTDLSESDIFVATTTKELFPRVPITITSYDIMVRMKDRFTIDTNRFYRMIIMDESHYIKSDDSKRTDIVSQLARSCKRLILLSGTPALSRPIELFPQINLIAPELFPSKHAFGVRYCQAQQKTFFANGRPRTVWYYKGADNLEELRIILENTIMIRRLKKDVLNQLPSKKREMISLPMDHMTEKQRAELNLYLSMMKKTKRHKDRSTLTFKWFQTSCEAKIPSVLTYIKDILDRNVKFICFCHHTIMMNSIEEMLRKERISFIRIDGSTMPKIRQEACDTFQNKDNFRIALLSLTACATGLNLTAASMVIFTELYWTPGVLAQAEDRAHRIGQSSNVRVIYLVAKTTIDEMMWPILSKKLEILNKAGLSRDTYEGTHNPLQNDDQQSLLTDFFNHIDQNTMDTLKIE